MHQLFEMHRGRDIAEWNRTCTLMLAFAGDGHKTIFDIHPYGKELREMVTKMRDGASVNREVSAFLGSML